MRKKIIAMLIVLTFLGIASFAFTSVSAQSSSEPAFLLGPEAIDATPEMLGEREIAIRKHAAEVGSEIATGASSTGEPMEDGDELIVSVADFDPDNADYNETFVVLMNGTYGNILIEKAAYDNYDPVTEEYIFPNPNNVWRAEDRISRTQLSNLLIEFDTNIFPTITGIFGMLLPRGIEGIKVWILIHNIRDESYYDPDQTSYVAGYFSASENSIQNKNMFHIDSYDWQNRVGPDGGRPYLYEGVFAHEFEHMIHFDQDPTEPSWVDEGLADLAGYLAGYGHSEGHLANYMVYHPWTALTFWGGGLEDYGASYLFQFYLYENFGGVAFTSALVQNTLDGIEGIESTLASLFYSETFDEIFDAWTIANYLDNPNQGSAPLKYGYDALTIGSSDTWGFTIEYVINGWWGLGDPYDVKHNKPFGSPGWYGIVPQPYTAHYFRSAHKRFSQVVFFGDATSGTTAHSGTYEWYSGAEAWTWRSFSQSFPIPAEGMTTLNFWTWYDIEKDWDYGYVEVYEPGADASGEWYTLADINGHTVSTDPNGPQDNPNVPVGQEPGDYLAADRWHAFTGYSGGWVEVSMDLTQFAGKTIDLYFRLWQDAAFTLQNMYVDDIEINNSVFPLDDVETDLRGWIPDGWYRTDGILPNNWAVTNLISTGVPTERYPADLESKELVTGPFEIPIFLIDPITQYGTAYWLPPFKHKDALVEVFIVSNRANHILTAYYEFYMLALQWKFEKHLV